MAHTLVVKKRFENKLLRVLEYLETDWNRKVAIDFSILLEKRLEHLLVTPYAGSLTGIKDVRSILVTKHNRLYYKITNSTIVILNMYDNRINPKKNAYKQ